jgi:hypothetical protein
MVRTQIQLDYAQAEALKRRAHRAGVSMAEAVRQAVALYLEQQPDEDARRRERALAAIGAFSAEPGLARDHDRVAFSGGEE